MGHYAMLVTATLTDAAVTRPPDEEIGFKLLELGFCEMEHDDDDPLTGIADWFSVDDHLVPDEQKHLLPGGYAPVSQAVYDEFLKRMEGFPVQYGDEPAPDFMDLEHEPVSPDFIGRKWLACVNYHV